MKRTGTFNTARQVFDNDVVGCCQHARFYAWSWLLSQAEYQDTPINIGDETIILKRGQLRHSVRHIAESVGMSRPMLARFLDLLRKGGVDGKPMIETSAGTGQLIITICNYDNFQYGIANFPETTSETLCETKSETPSFLANHSEQTEIPTASGFGETLSETPHETPTETIKKKDNKLKTKNPPNPPEGGTADMFEDPKPKKAEPFVPEFPSTLGLRPGVADAWIEMRTQSPKFKRSKLTEKGFRVCLTRIKQARDGGLDVNALVEDAVMNEWQGFPKQMIDDFIARASRNKPFDQRPDAGRTFEQSKEDRHLAALIRGANKSTAH